MTNEVKVPESETNKDLELQRIETELEEFYSRIQANIKNSEYRDLGKLAAFRPQKRGGSRRSH